MPETTREESGPMEALKFLEPDEIPMLDERFGSPLFVYDEESIRRSVAHLESLPSAFGHTIRYSLKACPSQAIIRLYDRMGVHFDASSVWEAVRAVRSGVAPAKILLTAQEAEFSGPLPDLVDEGMKFDAGSLSQLEEFGRHRPGSTVSIRINPGFGSGLVRRLTSGGPNSSFGIWHEYVAEVKAIVERYDLTVERLHTHIGSGHYSDVLLPAARLLLGLVTEFPDVRFLDLGGGYRLKVAAEDPDHDHREWAAALATEIAESPGASDRRLHLEMEPGTFLMANSGSVLTKVTDVVDTGSDGHRFVKINGGLTEVLRPSYYGTPHPLVAVSAEGKLPAEGPATCVAGHCCIAGDMLTTKAGDVESLEPMRLGNLRRGDYVVVERGGGYCSSMAMKNFNSYPEAAEVLRRRDGSYDVIRVRQDVDQLIVNERVPADLVTA